MGRHFAPGSSFQALLCFFSSVWSLSQKAVIFQRGQRRWSCSYLLFGIRGVDDLHLSQPVFGVSSYWYVFAFDSRFTRRFCFKDLDKCVFRKTRGCFIWLVSVALAVYRYCRKGLFRTAICACTCICDFSVCFNSDLSTH